MPEKAHELEKILDNYLIRLVLKMARRVTWKNTPLSKINSKHQ